MSEPTGGTGLPLPRSTTELDSLAGEKEGLYLEFKTPTELLRRSRGGVLGVRNVLRDELCETASAFLNSDGGIIVLGVQTSRDDAGGGDEILESTSDWEYRATFEGLQIPSLSDSQLSQMLHSNLSPVPEDISVRAIGAEVEGNRVVVFAIRVRPSRIGAHQSLRTKIYYRRSEASDEPMVDHEIRAVNARRQAPRLHIGAYVANPGGHTFWDREAGRSSIDVVDTDGTGDLAFRLGFRLVNHGQATAQDACLDIGIPNDLELRGGRPFHFPGSTGDFNPRLAARLGSPVSVLFRRQEGGRMVQGLTRQVCEQEVRWITINYTGIWHEGHPIYADDDVGIDLCLLPVGRAEANSKKASIRWIPWRATADRMPSIRGVARLEEDAISIGGDRPYWTFTVGDVPIGDASWAGALEADWFEELKTRMGRAER